MLVLVINSGSSSLKYQVREIGEDGAEPAEPVHQPRQLVIGHGQQHQLAAFHDGGYVEHRNIGEQGIRPFPACFGVGMHTHHGVARRA